MNKRITLKLSLSVIDISTCGVRKCIGGVAFSFDRNESYSERTITKTVKKQQQQTKEAKKSNYHGQTCRESPLSLYAVTLLLLLLTAIESAELLAEFAAAAAAAAANAIDGK